MVVFSWVLRGFVVCLAGLLPQVGVAHQSMDMDSGMAAMARPALAASAVFDTHGRLWLLGAHDGHLWLRHSDDLGKTLSKPVAVNMVAETLYAAGENRPQIVIGSEGQIDVAWTQKINAQWTGAIRFARSSDGGKHFSAPITVNHDHAIVTRGFVSLAIDSHGDIVLVWVDARDHAQAKAAGKVYAGFAMYASRSSDGGKHFSVERKLAEHSCECCRTTLVRTPQGEVASLFRSVYGDNIRDHTYAVLTRHGGAAAPQRATFSQWQVAACPDQGPGLAIGSDGVRHAVWYEASHGPAIWYGQLDPGHPPRHKLKLGSAGASHADVAAHGNSVWAVWNQVNAKGYTLMLRSSHDHGVSFGPPHALATSTLAVYSPQLLVHAGHAYVAWNTLEGFRLIAAAAK